MELSIFSQINETITRSENIIVALPGAMYTDAFFAGLSLRLILEKLGKTVVVVSSAKILPELNFLPVDGTVRSTLENDGLVILLRTAEKKLDELSYEEVGNQVNIFLKAKNGKFTANDISFLEPKVKCDLVITVGAQSLESLGSLFTDNADLFYDTPKINIDMHPANEYFGTINLVDTTASSLAEVILDLCNETQLVEFDENIATCLLAGIIANTHSFQDMHTTPRSLQKSAQLIELGARQQDIVKHLFKTKSLSLLKLWGRALARVKENLSVGFIYSTLTALDFQKADSSEALAVQVLQEFLDNSSGFKVVGLLAESVSGVTIFLSLHPQCNLEKFRKNLNLPPVVPRRLSSLQQFIEVMVPGTLLELEPRFTKALEESLSGQ